MLFLLPFSFFLAPLLFYKFHRYAYLLLIFLCISTSLLPFFSGFDILEYSWFSLNSQNFTITLKNDALTQQMVFLVNFIGICVIFYSQFYFEKSSFRYWLYLSLFLGSMHGLIISHHAILIFIFWELVGASSFLLIGYYYEKPESVYGSSKALWLNKIGDIGFLIGILGIFIEYKSLDLQVWLEKGTIPIEKSWILWFLILGALAKSAQGPFMIWLPDAMAGPTPASALIHAATMVAAGIYLLFRLFPIFTPEILILLSWLGSITALLGAIYALFQWRLKAILAGSTISQLGWMLSALGSSFPLTAIEHLWAHAFFKAGLFLTAGYIIHYQEHQFKNEDPQDIQFMGNFYSQNPKIYFVFCLFFAALMGVPLTSGYLTKETILASQEFSFTFYLLLASIFLTVLYSLKVLLALSNKTSQAPITSNLPPYPLSLPIYILGVCSLFWVVSFNPLHLNKPHLPEVRFSITLFSMSILLFSVFIFWKFQSFIVKLSSQTVSQFWGFNTFYNLWISQKFISRSEFIEKQNQLVVNRFLNPLFILGKILKFFEEKVLLGLIMALKNLFVTGKYVGIPISIAHFFQWMDTYIWDFGILSLTHSVLKIGKLNASFHTGRIQLYLIYSIVSLLLVVLFYYGIKF